MLLCLSSRHTISLVLHRSSKSSTKSHPLILLLLSRRTARRTGNTVPGEKLLVKLVGVLVRPFVAAAPTALLASFLPLAFALLLLCARHVLALAFREEAPTLAAHGHTTTLLQQTRVAAWGAGSAVRVIAFDESRGRADEEEHEDADEARVHLEMEDTVAGLSFVLFFLFDSRAFAFICAAFAFMWSVLITSCCVVVCSVCVLDRWLPSFRGRGRARASPKPRTASRVPRAYHIQKVRHQFRVAKTYRRHSSPPNQSAQSKVSNIRLSSPVHNLLRETSSPPLPLLTTTLVVIARV